MLFLILACRSTPAEGIAVGNPGDGYTAVSKSAGYSLESAWAPVSSLALIDCEGASTELAQGVQLPLDGSSSLYLPPGDWCGVSLSLSGPAELLYTRQDAELELELDLQPETAEGSGFTVDGNSLLLELGGLDWLGVLDWEPEPGELLEVRPGSAEHDALAERLESWVRLGEDGDGDGTLSEAEASASSPKAAEDIDREADTDDTDDDTGDRE